MAYAINETITDLFNSKANIILHNLTSRYDFDYESYIYGNEDQEVDLDEDELEYDDDYKKTIQNLIKKRLTDKIMFIKK